MTFIELKQMTFHAFHGVGEQERRVGNTYRIDLRLGLDIRRAALSDDLADTVNYAAVYAVLRDEMARPSCLIESVAARIVRRLRLDFPAIETLEIRLAKQNPPFGGDIREVAVVIAEGMEPGIGSD